MSEAAFKWNAIQSKIIFAFAHLILIVGLATAVFEFRNAMKHHETGRQMRQQRMDLLSVAPPGEILTPAMGASQEKIEIGPEKVAIKTATRAIWLLVSAFAFYYLYI